jgi:hypothetical protein
VIVLGSNADLFGDVRRTLLADSRFIDTGDTIHCDGAAAPLTNIYAVDMKRFADGQIVRDVDVDEVLQGRRLPADAWATREAAERACPEIGQGAWVEYATGRRVPDSPEA